MVAARQGNMKRKNMNKGGNMRKNFKQGQQQQQQNNGGFKQQFPRNNRGNGMNNMTNAQLFSQMMNSVSQMMDNPGYMDFNEPNIRTSYPSKNVPNNNGMNNQNGGGMIMNKNKINRGGRGGRFNKQGNGNGNPRGNINGNNNQRNGNGMGNNGNNVNNGNGNGGRFGSGRNQQQSGNFGMNGNMKNGNNGPYRNGGGPRMGPLNGMGNGVRPNDFDNFGGPQFYPQRFNPGPMMPPPPQMMRPPMRGAPIMSRRPLPPGPMPPFRSNNGPRNAPMKRKNKKLLQNNQRRANRLQNRRRVGKNNPNGEKYPLTKPWVTDEMKAAHAKKVELSNQLKGKKDDELFAEFKKQHDAFVAMYEAARVEFNKQKKQVNQFNQMILYYSKGIT